MQQLCTRISPTRALIALGATLAVLVLAMASIGPGAAQAACSDWHKTSPNVISTTSPCAKKFFVGNGWHVSKTKFSTRTCRTTKWRLVRDGYGRKPRSYLVACATNDGVFKATLGP